MAPFHPWEAQEARTRNAAKGADTDLVHLLLHIDDLAFSGALHGLALVILVKLHHSLLIPTLADLGAGQQLIQVLVSPAETHHAVPFAMAKKVFLFTVAGRFLHFPLVPRFCNMASEEEPDTQDETPRETEDPDGRKKKRRTADVKPEQVLSLPSLPSCGFISASLRPWKPQLCRMASHMCTLCPGLLLDHPGSLQSKWKC